MPGGTSSAAAPRRSWPAGCGRSSKHNLADALRDVARAKRDVARERPLENVDDSFSRADAWLAAVQSSPSQHAVKAEELLRMADALSQLPEPQRDAIVLHHLQGRPLAEVAEAMQRTTAAVAGLLHRGLKAMRTHSGTLSSRHSSGPGLQLLAAVRWRLSSDRAKPTV